MKKNLKISTAAIVFVLSITGGVYGACQCDGILQEPKYSGGDGQPLDWHYSVYLVRSGSATRKPLICFEKKVANKSNNKVKNIHWQIANFYRDKLLGGESKASCPMIGGELSQSPENGPLYFNLASSSHYDTTVVRPLEQQASADSSENSGWPILRSVFETSVGAEHFAKMVFYSVITPVQKKAMLTYQISNEGTGVVRVLVNLPVNTDALKQLTFVDKGITLARGDTAVFHTLVDRFEMKSALVTVFDKPQKNILAVEEAGFYVPSGGKTLRSDSGLWKFLKRQ